MRENYRAKAIRYLSEGRLTVRRADPHAITATCRGDSAEIYRLGYADGDWYCNCPAIGRCSHMQALMLVSVRPTGSAE
jgi:uncharacterized Zn finger protein